MNSNQQYIVSCQLMGGLGNQLFQIFTTMAYGIRNRRKFIFPYSETLNVGISRNTYWDTFLSMLKPITTFNTKHGVTNNDLMRFQRLREFAFHYHFIHNLQENLLFSVSALFAFALSVSAMFVSNCVATRSSFVFATCLWYRLLLLQRGCVLFCRKCCVGWVCCCGNSRK